MAHIPACRPAEPRPRLATIAASPALADTKVEPLTDEPPDGLSRALASGQLTEAEYALERARALFRPQAVAIASARSRS